MTTEGVLPAELIRAWRDRAGVLRAHAAEGAALAYEQAASELEASLAAAAGERLTLEAAARESGYSTRQLRTLLTDGRVPNAGRPHAPAIRRADLPKKPARATSGAASGARAFDPDAFAIAAHRQRTHRRAS